MVSEQRMGRVDDRLHALESAVKQLAAENLRYRLAAGMILLLAACGLVMAHAAGSQAPQEVRAQRFVLVDSNGQSRGAWLSAPDGSSLLNLTDASQRVRVGVGVTAAGSSELVFYDDRNRRRFAAGIDSADTTFLTLSHAEGTSASASITVAGAGTPMIRLTDAAGAPRLVAGVIDDEVSLALMGRETRLGAILAVDAETSRLALADGAGVERMWAAIRKDSPVLQFFDRNRAARSGLATINDDSGLAVISESPGAAAPGLVLYGKNMKLLWAAPQ